MKKVLYINGEEKPNSSGVYNAIWHVLKELGVSFESDLAEFKKTAKKHPNSARKYTLGGFYSEDGSLIEVEYSIVTGKKSMIDLLFYWRTSAPTVRTVPDYLVEITKNAFDESGNMSDQRAAKVLDAWYTYGQKIPYLYLLNMGEGSKTTPTPAHARALNRMKILGAKVGLSIEGRVGVAEIALPERVTKITTVAELVEEDLYNASRDARVILDSKGNLVLRARLDKSDDAKQTSDPNVGFVTSTVHAAIALGHSGGFLIEGHKKDPKYFKGNSKLARLLSLAVAEGHQVQVEGISGSLNPKNNSNETPYYKDEHRGEKNGTIALENLLVQSEEWESIFDNHAGCEKSDFILANGNRIQIPKKLNGLPLGLPDLVLINRATKRILVVEGEMSENLCSLSYDKGYNQVRDLKFERTAKWMAAYYPGYALEIHMATFGEDTGEEILYHLNKDGSQVYNKDAEPVYVVGSSREKEELNEIYWQQNETINLSARVNY